MTMRRFRRMRRKPAPTTDARSADERLEALVREPNVERRERMMGRIREGLEDAPRTIAPWITAARTLADRLIIGFEAYQYLAYAFAECRLYDASQTDAELVRLAADIGAVERSHGLREDESFHADDAPEDWSALNSAWEKRADDIIAESLREGGAGEVAQAMIADRAAFDRTMDAGYDEVFPEPA